MNPTCPRCGQPIQKYEEWRGWGVDVSKNIVTGPNGRTKVPRDSASAMYLLIKAKGAVVSMDAMMSGILGGDRPNNPTSRVYVAVCNLRRSFGKDAIKNVHGDGWYLT